MNKENKPKFTSEEMTNFNVDAIFNALNKENIEPKKIHSTRELISRMYTNAANLKHIAETGTINGSLLQEIERVMNEYANQFRGVTESPDQTPAISSNEGETLTDAQVYAERINFDYYERKGFYFLAIDAFKAGQSQHSYTEDKWIKVEDTEEMPMPSFEVKTQIICENGEQHIGYFNGADTHGYVWFCDNNDYHYPTHWQPLPSPPKK